MTLFTDYGFVEDFRNNADGKFFADVAGHELRLLSAGFLTRPRPPRTSENSEH